MQSTVHTPLASGLGLREEKLLTMESVNSISLTGLQLRGTYTENGETKPCSYTLTFAPDGSFQGNGQDDDGIARVQGKLLWRAGDSQGEIAFVEVRGSTRSEMRLRGRTLLTFLGDSNLLKVRSLDSFCLFFLSDNRIEDNELKCSKCFDRKAKLTLAFRTSKC